MGKAAIQEIETEVQKIQTEAKAVQGSKTTVQSNETAVQKHQTEVQKNEISVQNDGTPVQSIETEAHDSQSAVPNDANRAELTLDASRKAARESTGRISDDGGTSVFFTAEQVKAMTPMQVRANYERIIESMSRSTFY